jgi:hypothetical protein
MKCHLQSFKLPGHLILDANIKIVVHNEWPMPTCLCHSSPFRFAQLKPGSIRHVRLDEFTANNAHVLLGTKLIQQIL